MRQKAMKRFNYIKDIGTVRDVIKGRKKGPRSTLFAHSDGFYPQALYSLNYDKELCLVSTFTSIRKTPQSFYIRKDSIHRETLNQRFFKLLNFDMPLKRLKVNHIDSLFLQDSVVY